MLQTMGKFSVLGVGRVGGALALALSGKGFEIENLIVKNKRQAEVVTKNIASNPNVLSFDELSEISSDIVFITTRDFEIEAAAQRLSEKIKNRSAVVFHTSGSRSSEILQALREIGCATGSIHPLTSISDAELGAQRLEGANFCIEGDARAVEIAEQIVAALGGKHFSIETRYKTLYHASAVTACGHLVALIDTAIEMLSACGLSEAAAKETLLPLIKSTVENLEVQNPAEALTGTFARADVKTFERHLAAIEEGVSGEAREIYLQLGARSAHLAQRQGANADDLREILDKISLAKKNFKC
jgi:predicted short-subunit dehydrogenase-like oxidoreductase (DUF2520 family)